MPHYPFEIRDKHTFIGGRIGYGKSTLIAHQAWYDMDFNLGGVAVIDPKGDLVDNLLYHIPDKRVDDCIWLDIKDPIPLDFMSCTQDNEELLVSDLKFILTKGMDLSGAPNLGDNIENVIYTLLEINRHIPKTYVPEDPSQTRATFLDIHHFLEDPKRYKFLKQFIKTERYRAMWEQNVQQYKKPLPDVDRGRIRTRMGTFIKGRTMPIIFGDPEANLNMTEVIEKKKILLIKVPFHSGEAGKLYGSLLMAKIQQAAFSEARQETPEEDRIPFYCFIDEFQRFQAREAFDETLLMGRSFKLCLTLACPLLANPEIPQSVRSALGIISTYIIFRVAPEDVSFYSYLIPKNQGTFQAYWDKQQNLEVELQSIPSSDPKFMQVFNKLHEIRKFTDDIPLAVTIEDALTLRKFQAIYMIAEQRPIIEPTPEPPPKPTQAQKEKAQYIKEHTREQYGPNRNRDTSAQNGSIRTGDKPPSDTTKNMPKLEEDDEDIKPGA